MRPSFNNRATPVIASKTAALMDRSRKKKGTRGCSWFSLYLWPAFRRIFLLDNKPELWHRRAEPGLRLVVAGAKKQHDNAPASRVPQIVIDTQLENWIRWALETNITLAAALRRLRNSYNLLRAGNPAVDAEEILAEVQAALKAIEESSM
jgi:hypothetical protein